LNASPAFIAPEVNPLRFPPRFVPYLRNATSPAPASSSGAGRSATAAAKSANPTISGSSCCTRPSAASISFPNAGSSSAPIAAFASANAAVSLACFPAAVSASRAFAPVASAVCFINRDKVACESACLSAAPVSPVNPSASFSAFTSACLIETPYFSIGSRSPLSSADTADTASAVDPPNWAARSAPRLISLSVDGARSSIDVPAAFSWDPIRVARFEYSVLDRPIDFAELSAQAFTAPALVLNTASRPPTACSASDAADTTDLANPATATAPMILVSISTVSPAVLLATSGRLPGLGVPPVQFVQRRQQQPVIGVQPVVGGRPRVGQRQLHS
jgi:hypothetical protein